MEKEVSSHCFSQNNPVIDSDEGDLVSDDEVLKADGVDDDFNINETEDQVETGKKRKLSGQERKLPREL